MTLAGLLAGWRRPAAPRPIAETPRIAVVRDADLSTTRSVSRTHVGRVRTVNEDRVFEDSAHGLWAVADGMGGHFAGDVAAEATVQALRTLADGDTPLGGDAIAAALADAGRRIHADAAGSTRVSGSTIVALHIDGAQGSLFWAGDSRAYRARGGRLEQLSRDHSIVQELVDAGALTAAQADRHPQSHVITRALGASSEVEIERCAIVVRPGDVYLLCSDGLTRGNADMAVLDAADRPLGDVADALMTAALARGGADNISLVLIAVA